MNVLALIDDKVAVGVAIVSRAMAALLVSDLVPFNSVLRSTAFGVGVVGAVSIVMLPADGSRSVIPYIRCELMVGVMIGLPVLLTMSAMRSVFEFVEGMRR